MTFNSNGFILTVLQMELMEGIGDSIMRLPLRNLGPMAVLSNQQYALSLYMSTELYLAPCCRAPICASDLEACCEFWCNHQTLRPGEQKNEQTLELWFAEMTDGGDNASHTLAILVLCALWSQRNDHIFQHREKKAEAPLFYLVDECNLWKLAGTKALSRIVALPNRK